MSRSLVKRSDKKAFWGVPSADGGEVTFTRMQGFTELSGSKNPKEYSRQYVDEAFERTDVVGYSPSWSFAFDSYTDDAVLEDLYLILTYEKTGIDAQRDVIFVDFSCPVVEVDGAPSGFLATKRVFSVIGDAEGNSLDAYTYSGNLRPVGDQVMGIATIKTPASGNSETVETISFNAASE